MLLGQERGQSVFLYHFPLLTVQVTLNSNQCAIVAYRATTPLSPNNNIDSLLILVKIHVSN